MSTLRLTTISNQSGSASVPSDTVINGSAKAWVNFNGTGTVAIRASFNVSSITDGGTGVYTVNFTSAFSDVNYAVAGSAGSQLNSGVDNGVVCPFNRTAAGFSFVTRNVQGSGVATDYDSVNLSFFR